MGTYRFYRTPIGLIGFHTKPIGFTGFYMLKLELDLSAGLEAGVEAEPTPAAAA